MKKIYVFVSIVLIVVTLFLTNNKITNVFAQSNILETSAESYVVVDDNNKILLEKNADKKREVASICKLMTTLITLENLENGNINLDTKFLTSSYAASVEGSQAFLDAGSEYSVGELLKSVVVASANDSAIVLAEGLAGSEDNFVNLMNEKADDLMMLNTRYSNSTGLPAIEQYSTAYDTSLLLREVSKYNLYQEYCKIWIDDFVHPSGRVTELVNTNRLIKYYPYCKTGKTGFTDEAGYCLATTNEKNNLALTCVVLGSKNSASRFTESIELLNNAYANFKSVQLVSKDTAVENNIMIKSGNDNAIELITQDDYFVTVNNKENINDYNIVYQLPQSLKAPIEQGDLVGEILIVKDSEVVGSVDIISAEKISKQTFKDCVNKVLDKFKTFN